MRVERYAQEQVPKQDQQFILSGGQSSEGKKVTGIGGIMFKSKDPKATRKWYEENLGIKDDPNGHLFEWIDKDDRSTVGVTVWSPMPSATEYLGKPEQQFMINYRVENLEQLAKELHGEVGASRAAVDAGFCEHDLQIGQTGVTVRPKVYIACGISGAIQHVAGMKESGIVISVNSDPNAPINDIADYVITGTVEEVLPKMIKYYKENNK